MAEILLATTADHIFDDISATLARPGTRVNRITHGADVAATVAELKPDVVLLDLQIGNMGGAAACRNLRLEQGANRLPETKVIILLDREVDRANALWAHGCDESPTATDVGLPRPPVGLEDDMKRLFRNRSAASDPRGERAQVIVETAIALPLQLVITLAIMQYCLIAGAKLRLILPRAPIQIAGRTPLVPTWVAVLLAAVSIAAAVLAVTGVQFDYDFTRLSAKPPPSLRLVKQRHRSVYSGVSAPARRMKSSSPDPKSCPSEPMT